MSRLCRCVHYFDHEITDNTAFFATSTFDRYHTPDMSLEEGLELKKRATNEVAKRLIVNPGGWKARIITQDGVREVIL